MQDAENSLRRNSYHSMGEIKPYDRENAWMNLTGEVN